MSLAKQDRHGARTPADLENKYSFGNEQKTVDELRRMNASFERTISEARTLLANMTEQLEKMESKVNGLFSLVQVVETDGEWVLEESTYPDLKAVFDEGGIITLHINHSDEERRYYHCMGTRLHGEVEGLIFQYGYGSTAQCIFVGSDGSVAVEDVNLEEKA